MDIQEKVLQPRIYAESPAVDPAINPAIDPVTASQTAYQPVALHTKILYGLGEGSNSIKTFTFGFFLLFFYTSVMGLSGTLVGIAVAAGLVWDAVIDPLIGYVSDGVKASFGRRHTFMLIGSICMGIAFYTIFRPPIGWSTSALFVWLMVTSLALRTTSSLFMVPYQALGAELSQDYHERTSITATRAAIALASTLLVAALSLLVFFPNKTPGVDPKFNLEGYASMGWAFGLAMTALGLIATVGTLSQRQRIKPSRSVAATDRPSFGAGFLLALRNPTFLVLILSGSLFFLGSVINATTAIHYLTYYAGITASNAIAAFQLAFYIGALLGVLFWLRMARTYEKQRLYLSATIMVALILLAAYWLVGQDHLLGTGNLLALAIGNSIAGFFASALWVLTPSMLADVVDLDALTSGSRREGAFFGIFSFSQQMAASLAILVSGVMVDHFAKLVPGQIDQSAQTIDRLAMIFSFLPAALLLAAAFFIYRYRLTRQELELVQKQLAERSV